MSFRRVNKNFPCLICDKTDWCLRAEDDSAIICQRVASSRRIGDAGFLHILQSGHHDNSHQGTFRIQKKASYDFEQLSKRFTKQMTPASYKMAAESLGVSTEALKRLQIGKYEQSFTFPMKNQSGRTIGIRRRFCNGKKICIKGSKTGLFIPQYLDDKGPLLIVEGNTDAAAGLELGYNVIGRPNCNSCIVMTQTVCRGRDVVIVADNDEIKTDGRKPGQEGARILAERLVFVCQTVRVVLPPFEYKDLRSWYQNGLRRDKFQKNIDDTTPIKLEIKRNGV